VRPTNFGQFFSREAQWSRMEKKKNPGSKEGENEGGLQSFSGADNSDEGRCMLMDRLVRKGDKLGGGLGRTIREGKISVNEKLIRGGDCWTWGTGGP